MCPQPVPGGAGGDIDQIAADGGAAGSGVGEAGQDQAAPSRLCANAAQVSQAALAGKIPEVRPGTARPARHVYSHQASNLRASASSSMFAADMFSSR